MDIQRIIAEVAREKRADPALGLAVGDVESGLDPGAVGDRDTPYPSYGVFQERVVVGRGGLATPDADPRRQAERFYDDVLAYLRAGGGGTPGEIAAAVQRPDDPVGYAQKVDRRYRTFLGMQETGGGQPRTLAPVQCPTGQHWRMIEGRCVSDDAAPWDPRGEVQREGKLIPDPKKAAENVGKAVEDATRAVTDPLGPVAQAINKAREGAAQALIGLVVVGTAGALAYSGVRKMLG